MPVRVTYNDRGLRDGAEIPNRDKGRLVIASTHLSKIDQSSNVVELSEARFEELVQSFLSES